MVKRRHVAGAYRLFAIIADAGTIWLFQRFTTQRTRLNNRLKSKDVTSGKYKDILSRSITMSPGRRPSPIRLRYGQSNPITRIARPSTIRKRAIARPAKCFGSSSSYRGNLVLCHDGCQVSVIRTLTQTLSRDRPIAAVTLSPADKPEWRRKAHRSKRWSSP